MSEYMVKDVVCDNGIFIVDDFGNEELIEACNSRANALKICEILNADLKHMVYEDSSNRELIELHRELQQKDDQLKQQLAEKDQAIKEWQTMYEGVTRTCANDYKEILRLREELAESEKSKEINIKERDKICLEMATDYNRQILELKQQLAEKEKEIENNKQGINTAIKFYSDEFVEKDKELKELRWKVKQADQDKISFAVEQLEKVKEKLIDEIENVTELIDPLEYEDYHELIGCGRGYKNSIEEIDNQIKQLKEVK